MRTPPLLCIEILSPEDSFGNMRTRVRDYLDMGVPEVWVIDPSTRTVFVSGAAFTEEHTEGEHAVGDTPVRVRFNDLFRVLDRRRDVVDHLRPVLLSVLTRLDRWARGRCRVCGCRRVGAGWRCRGS